MRRRNRFDWIAFVWALLAAGVLGLIVWAYVLEIEFFSLYLSVWSFFKVAIIAGIILGILVGFLMTLKVKATYDRMRIFLLMVFAGCIIVPIIFSLLNRKLSSEEVIYESVEVVEITPYLDAGFGLMEKDKNKIKYYKVVITQDGVTKTIYPASLPLNAQEGESLRLPVRKGFFGFDWAQIEETEKY